MNAFPVRHLILLLFLELSSTSSPSTAKLDVAKVRTVSAIVAIMAWTRLEDHRKLNRAIKLKRTYDYIVVGAGSAGCTVAARLAEKSTRKVLLLEAGGPQNAVSDIPALQNRLFGSYFDWNYPIVPQKRSYLAYENNAHNFHRGRGFGGSSIINSMNYYKENEEYFKFWSDVTGVRNWTYDHILPYFKRSENNLDKELVAKEPTLHGTDGPLFVSTQEPDPILHNHNIAAQLLGYPATHRDGKQPFGTTVMQKTIKDGVRQTASLVYLEQRPRHNLDILGDSLVTKILFDAQNRAIGVRFFRKNKFHTVYAQKEVIVSAGSIGTPQLLLLSGIGPKAHLKRMDIPVIADLAVGHNLLSQVSTILEFEIKNQSLVDRPIPNLKNYYDYYVNKSGPLVYKGAGLVCYKEVAHPDRPELSNGCNSPRVYYIDEEPEELISEYKLKDQWRQYYKPYLKKSVFQLITFLKHPKSWGRIRLASADPFDKPLIDPGYFAHRQDLEYLVAAFKKSLEIYLSAHMRQYIKPLRYPVPGCDPCPRNYFCDSYIQCICQSISSFYPMGGCRMGIASDRRAVVDNRLRVFGVTGLRVIDASVAPVASDQSNAIVIAIGEYGSQLINDDDLGDSHKPVLTNTTTMPAS